MQAASTRFDLNATELKTWVIASGFIRPFFLLNTNNMIAFVSPHILQPNEKYTKKIINTFKNEFLRCIMFSGATSLEGQGEYHPEA